LSYTTLISTETVAQHLNDPDWAIIDCRFSLAEPAAGRQKYHEAHIPGAVYAHLDEDLSGPIIPGKTGRHPLPAIETFAATLSAWGIDAQTQVVAYDDAAGMVAGRLWAMLRWLGHDAVAVLDGDFRHWSKEGRPVTSGTEQRAPRTFVAQPHPAMHASADEVMANLQEQKYKVFDARDERRYHGEKNPLDPAAGHIPGAFSAFYAHNLDANGKFLAPEILRERYTKLLGDAKPEACIFYCGSGVSANHDLLAMEHAGLGRGARVYIGSWSDWASDPTRPVETDSPQ